MPLTDTAIRNAKHGVKPIKLADERGLFLLLQPSGGKLWRLKYRFGGKEQKLSLGQYPDIGLKEARRRRDVARTQIAEGVDPSAVRRADALSAKIGAAITFQSVGEEYLEKAAREGREAVTIKKSLWLLTLLSQRIGARPINEISPAELLVALKTVEAKGHYETARRMRSLAGRIFRYAVATSRANGDPTIMLRGALIAPKTTHHSAILDSDKVGDLLRAIDGYEGQPLTCIAIKITPHVFVRPGELRRAEWKEFDFDARVWTIPAEKMKMREPHRVPLSSQVLELLRDARILSGSQQYVFSSLYPGTRPMSENTVNAALRRLGYTGSEMTAHGFRAMASTLLNESGMWPADVIERALGHRDTNAVRAAYHRGAHWKDRIAMATWWSDYLDDLKCT